MKNKLIALLIFGMCAGSVWAQSRAPQGSAPPPKGKNPALDAALSACAASVAKDAQGRPERAAMDACMKAKGFEKPPHRGPKGDGQGGHPPPPPSGSSSGSAS